MPARDLRAAFDRAISGRHLLEHPYYQGWRDGQLTVQDLAEYAGQYRHVERCLPDVLALTAERLDQGSARRLVEENLSDERSRPRPHIDLFEGFAEAVGSHADVAPTKATQELVARYEEAASADPVGALAVVGAYELQAAEVAATKADALRGHYGIDPAGTEFWDVHANLEQSHAAWTLEALGALGAAPTTVLEFATASAKAWWAFLDERDAARLS